MAKNLNARFFRDFRDDSKNMVEVTIVSCKDTHIRRVKAEDLTDFAKEWEAYSNGMENVDYGGTPLTEVPGITGSIVMNYKLNGIHNAEMLAEIPDIACKNLGTGAMAARTSAKNLIEAKKAKASADENESLKLRIAELEKQSSAKLSLPQQGPQKPPQQPPARQV